MLAGHNHVLAQRQDMNVDGAKSYGCDYATIIHKTPQTAQLIAALLLIFKLAFSIFTLLLASNCAAAFILLILEVHLKLRAVNNMKCRGIVDLIQVCFTHNTVVPQESLPER
jgi:hypothetical protein